MPSLSFSSSHQVTLKTILLFLVSCSLPLLVPVSGEGDALQVNSENKCDVSLCLIFLFFVLKVEAGQNDTGESDLTVPVSGEGDALKVNFGK